MTYLKLHDWIFHRVRKKLRVNFATRDFDALLLFFGSNYKQLVLKLTISVDYDFKKAQ